MHSLLKMHFPLRKNLHIGVCQWLHLSPLRHLPFVFQVHGFASVLPEGEVPLRLL